MDSSGMKGAVPSSVTHATDWELRITSDPHVALGTWECRVGGVVELGLTPAEAIGAAIGRLRDLAWPAIVEAARQAEELGQAARRGSRDLRSV